MTIRVSVHHEINEIDDLPTMTTIFKTFGGIKEVYKRIGYDYDVSWE